MSQRIVTGTYRRTQLEYMPERKTRDALAQLVLTWSSLFANKRKIAVCCSDSKGFRFGELKTAVVQITGTRSSHEIPCDTAVMDEKRKARVAIGNKFSKDLNINNMVYQNVVLGPPL